MRSRNSSELDRDDLEGAPGSNVQLHRHAPTLFKFICRMGFREDAADLVQETFFRWLRYPPLRKVTNTEGYLFRIAQNVVRDYHRKQQKEPWVHRSISAEELAERSADEDNTAADFVEAIGLKQEVQQILSGIPALYRNVLLMRYRDDMGITEIAAKIGKSERSVRDYLDAGLALCQSKLRREG